MFYADDVWARISALTNLNALQMEDQLARLADLVIIIVESPGTFAELGAFSLSDELRVKLLPIIHKKYVGADSFINTGPVRWINEKSSFAPTIFVDHSLVLSASAEIEERLARIIPSPRQKIKDIGGSPKHLLFLLCDLLAVIGPAPAVHCKGYFDAILEKPSAWDVENLLSLLATLGLVRSVRDGSGREAFYRPARRWRVAAISRQKDL